MELIALTIAKSVVKVAVSKLMRLGVDASITYDDMEKLLDKYAAIYKVFELLPTNVREDLKKGMENLQSLVNACLEIANTDGPFDTLVAVIKDNFVGIKKALEITNCTAIDHLLAAVLELDSMNRQLEYDGLIGQLETLLVGFPIHVDLLLPDMFRNATGSDLCSAEDRGQFTLIVSSLEHVSYLEAIKSIITELKRPPSVDGLPDGPISEQDVTNYFKEHEDAGNGFKKALDESKRDGSCGFEGCGCQKFEPDFTISSKCLSCKCGHKMEEHAK